MYSILSVFVDTTDEVRALEDAPGLSVGPPNSNQPFNLYVATSGRDEYAGGIRVCDTLIERLQEVRANLLRKSVREADDSNRPEA